MLKDFYKITEQKIISTSGQADSGTGVFQFTIELNPSHPVYEGHFPGNPVVPGVCQVQIIKELASRVLKTDLRLVNSDNIKFLSMIVPQRNPALEVVIETREEEQQHWVVNGTILSGQTIFLKFRGRMHLA
jgi:3-hydroxyacyl-[acyl-carrier-protein] dehydratase